MARLYENLTQTVGNTPLVRVNRLFGPDVRVYAKLEYFNPLSSVKDRIGVAMIEDALAKGQIQDGTRVIEPTSGNTGVGLAFACAVYGIKLTLVMPESMSVERRKVLAALGADLVLTPAAEGMKGAIGRAEQLAGETADSFMPQQFRNPANVEVHKRTTAEEIWHDTEGAVDVLVAGVGTGGTLTGVGEVIKARKPSFRTVAVEPKDSPVISQVRSGQSPQPGPHKIQGIGAGFIPENLHLDVVDETIQIENETSFQWARRAAREEGMLCGISSGAALAAVDRLVRRSAYREKLIVVVLASAGERYLSTPLFEGLPW